MGITGLRDAVKGEPRPALEAIRDALALSIESAAANEVAALSKQLVAVLADIAALPALKVSAVDDIATQRARRKAVPSDASAKGVKRRAGSDGAGG